MKLETVIRLVIVAVVVLAACTTIERRIVIDGREHIERTTELCGLQVARDVEPVPTPAEQSAERRARVGDWGVTILIAGALLAGIGTALSMAIANKPVQWAANIAATAGYGAVAAGLFLMGVAKWMHWLWLGTAAAGTVILVHKFKDKGIDAWLTRLLNGEEHAVQRSETSAPPT